MGRIHADDLAGRCGTARLACVQDADPAVAREAGERYGVPWVSSFAELLAHDDVGAVAIATPTGTHAELTVQAARAGVDVFCEKPISLDRATTVATVEEVERSGIVFQVGFHRRFDPDWVAVAERIHAGELGTSPCSARRCGTWPLPRRRSWPAPAASSGTSRCTTWTWPAGWSARSSR
ncbi:Gfo/Idh/MocA family oxidoreductase [Pseudonocardia sp. T1-2H]